MSVIKNNELKLFIKQIFSELNLDEEIAKHTIEGISHTSLRGVDTHGLRLLPHYVRGIQSGRINLNPKITFSSNYISTFIMDADHTFGHAAGMIAMKHAINIAKKYGIGAVSVKNSSHCGALSFFGEEAAKLDW